MKFQVGDKVKIVANVHEHGFSIGDTVTIKTKDIECKNYTAEDERDWWWVEDDEIEPA